MTPSTQRERAREIAEECSLTSPKPLSPEWIEQLREQHRRLGALLDDPHPGLATWCLMLGGVMQKIGEMTK